MRRQCLRFAVIAATVVFGGLAATALAVPGTASASYKAKITGGVLTFTGNAASDKLVLRLKPGGETKLQGDVGGNGTAEFEFGRGLFTSIVVNAGGGNDAVVVSEANGVFTTTEATTLNGGGGKDKLTGGTGGEALRGGPARTRSRAGAGRTPSSGRRATETTRSTARATPTPSASPALRPTTPSPFGRARAACGRMWASRPSSLRQSRAPMSRRSTASTRST